MVWYPIADWLILYYVLLFTLPITVVACVLLRRAKERANIRRSRALDRAEKHHKKD